MAKEKVLRKLVKRQRRGTKITTIGLKRVFDKGPQIIPFLRTIYQKREEPLPPGSTPNLFQFVFNRSMSFIPSDYNASDPNEKKNLAYQDAINHRALYQDLIKEGIYPAETKVKVKKGKHTNAYILEISMPKVKNNFRDALSRKKFAVKEGRARTEEIEEMLRQRDNVSYKIQKIVREKGEKLSKGEGYEPRFDNDLHEKFNYGIDENGNIVYFDQHVITKKLPFEKRKDTNTLEKTLTSIMALTGLGAGIFFLSPTLTGNAIANLTTKTSSIIGAGLFIVGIVGSYFWFRKK